MSTRLFALDCLQPTDYLRPESMLFLSSLSFEDLRSLGLPQVWQVGDSYVISDGNNRAAQIVSRGCKETAVDFQGDLFDSMAGFEEIVLERAERLRGEGVYSVYDLLRI